MHADSTPRTCAWCGNPLAQRPGEQNLHFAKRIACGNSCANRFRWARDKTRLAPKPCVVCGAPIEHDETKPYQHRKRETCSHSCKITLANRRRYAKFEPAPKPCVICGESMTRRAGEMIASFKLRKTCSPICHIELLRLHNTTRVYEHRATPYPPEFNDALKERVRTRDGHVCRLCGAPELLERSHAVHHIDYDKSHCVMGNLVTLCQPCHVRTNRNREYWQALFDEMLAT